LQSCRVLRSGGLEGREGFRSGEGKEVLLSRRHDRGMDATVTNRVGKGWGKFNTLLPLLRVKGVSGV
jgi:hypothetical protein